MLEELRKLSDHNLKQVFEMQREVAKYKALENMPIALCKLLKKSFEKNGSGVQQNMMSIDEEFSEYG